METEFKTTPQRLRVNRRTRVLNNFNAAVINRRARTNIPGEAGQDAAVMRFIAKNGAALTALADA